MKTSKRSVVVVDDNEAQAHLFEEFLSGNGYDVHVALTGHEGLAKIRDLRPDIVLLDLVLPDISGSDVCSQLRADKSTHSIPIILCTATSITPEQKVKGFRAGADDYLVRPFELAELLARMEAVLRRSAVQAKSDTLAGIQALLSKSPKEPERSSGIELPPFPEAPLAPVSHAPPVDSMPGPEPIKSHSGAPKIFSRIGQLLNHPVGVFTSLNESEDLFVAAALVFGTPILSSLVKLFQRTGGFDAWIGVFSLGVVAHFILWFALAGLLHMVLPFEGVHMPMKRALVFAGFGWAPRILQSALGVVYLFVASAGLAGEPVKFTSGIDMIPGVPSSGLFSLVAKIGIFDLWAVGITLIGVWTLPRTHRSRLTTITILIGVSCLLIGVISSF